MIDRLNAALRKVPVSLLYALAPLPPAYLLYLAFTGGLGVDPVKALEHQLGEWGLQVLVFVLAITPLRKFLGLNLIKFRRALGLIGFFYVVLHLIVWLVLDVQILSQILDDIAKRPYITVGMAALVLMLPLAITSNNYSIRKLGRRWRKLHWLTYPAVILGAVHYVMLVKGWQLEPLVYLGVIVAFLLARIDFKPRRRKQP